MHDFTVRLASRIQGDDPEMVSAALSDISEAMRIWSRFGGDPERARAMVGPFSDTEPFPRFAHEDIARLKNVLMEFVRTNIDREIATTAFHALMVLGARDTREFMVTALEHAVANGSAALFQILLALEAVGESVFPPDQLSRSFDDAANLNVAMAYLSQVTTGGSAAGLTRTES